MYIRAGFEISYDCPAPSPMMLMLSVHPSRRGDLKTPDVLSVDRPIAIHQYLDSFGNICSRVLAPEGRTTFSADFVIEDSGLPDPVIPAAALNPVETLPDEALLYLLGSRYCETDRMADLAWSLFQSTAPGWARVEAIVAYAHQRIGFGYEHARRTRTAFEGHEERLGVCRDYAHLAVALCRCMNIPARYCTGYLGDIGVPVAGEMDFSAWFEAYVGGAWRTFDARHNKPRIGRILMAIGRDATDVALATTFGPAELAGFKVTTVELSDEEAEDAIRTLSVTAPLNAAARAPT
jgi:transglutaminase-like putative cysteine protease